MEEYGDGRWTRKKTLKLDTNKRQKSKKKIKFKDDDYFESYS